MLGNSLHTNIACKLTFQCSFYMFGSLSILQSHYLSKIASAQLILSKDGSYSKMSYSNIKAHKQYSDNF